MRGLRELGGVLTVVCAVVSVASAADNPTFYPTWQAFTTEDGLPDSSIRAIHTDGDGVWVGTDGGLALRENGTWRRWTSDDGLPRAPVTAIDTDSRTGDVWLGTRGGGLVRFTAGRFDRFTQYSSGLAGDLVLDVVVSDGIVWAATNGGISSFEPTEENWGLFLEARVDFPPQAATSLCEHGEAVYVGTWCGPLLRLEPSGDTAAPMITSELETGPGIRASRPGGATAVATAGSSATLWWTVRGDLLRREHGKRWRRLGAGAPGGEDAFVNCIAAKNDREVWLGTAAGVRVLTDWDSRSWTSYRLGGDGTSGVVALERSGRIRGRRKLASLFPDERIRCLAFEGDDVWVGTAAGLARGSGRKPWSGPTSRATAKAESPRSPETKAWRGEARIGMLASSSTPIPRPGSLSPWPENPVDRVAVGRAVERANSRLAQTGKSIVLAANLDSFAGFGWGTVQDSFAVLRHRDDVSGIVAYIGAGDRMDSALALHTELPVVNFAPTEPPIHESENPWVFRCGVNDPRRARRLMEHLLGSGSHVRPVVLTTPGSESRAQLDRWVDQVERFGHGPVPMFAVDPQAENLEPLFEALRRLQADVLLTWADAPATATIVRRLRAAGLNQLVVGSPRIVTPEFITLAGARAGDVVAASRCPHFEVAGDLPQLDEERLRRRPAIARVVPTPQAQGSYDAAVHLIVAIERAGPDREAVRETLRAMGSPGLARLEAGVWKSSPIDASAED